MVYISSILVYISFFIKWRWYNDWAISVFHLVYANITWIFYITSLYNVWRLINICCCIICCLIHRNISSILGKGLKIGSTLTSRHIKWLVSVVESFKIHLCSIFITILWHNKSFSWFHYYKWLIFTPKHKKLELCKYFKYTYQKTSACWFSIYLIIETIIKALLQFDLFVPITRLWKL